MHLHTIEANVYLDMAGRFSTHVGFTFTTFGDDGVADLWACTRNRAIGGFAVVHHETREGYAATRDAEVCPQREMSGTDESYNKLNILKTWCIWESVRPFVGVRGTRRGQTFGRPGWGCGPRAAFRRGSLEHTGRLQRSS